MVDSLFLLLPLIFLSGMTLALLMMGAFGSDYASVRNMGLFSLLVVGATYLVARAPSGSEYGFDGLFIRDGLSDYAAILILVGLGFALLLSDSWLRLESLVRYEYTVLVLFSGIGMLLLVSASNLMTLYLAMELQSLPLYVLAAWRTRDLLSNEAGLKYFVLGSLSSGIMLFGMSLVYGFTGTLAFSELSFEVGGAVVGMTLVMIGLGFKLSASPFHMWTPDVYEGSPTPVTALFAMVPKVAALVVLARLYVLDSSSVASLQSVLWFLAFLSMVWGAFAALGQTRIKRLLAYSAIGNIGYALMGLASGTALGLESALVYITIYLVTMAGVFAIILSMRRDGRALESLDDLRGFSEHHPVVALLLAVLMFSAAGIPPFAGFFAKVYVFRAALDSGLVLLAVSGAITAVVAAFYYLRIIRLMYFDKGSSAHDRPLSPALSFVMFLSAALVAGFLLSPSGLVSMARLAALSVFS
ncbi:MAG: NADH-quinone oxidoreductase subunit NuoN [Alphaproteobacteria bacterium]